VLCSLLLFKSMVRRSAERRYAIRFPPVCRNIHPRRSQSAATFRPPQFSPLPPHSEATEEPLDWPVRTIPGFFRKKGLTKIRTYDLIGNVRNVGTRRPRIREDAAGAGGAGGEQRSRNENED